MPTHHPSFPILLYRQTHPGHWQRLHWKGLTVSPRKALLVLPQLRLRLRPTLVRRRQARLLVTTSRSLTVCLVFRSVRECVALVEAVGWTSSVTQSPMPVSESDETTKRYLVRLLHEPSFRTYCRRVERLLEEEHERGLLWME